MQLNHEKLDVYQAAIEFLGFSFHMIQSLPPGYGFLVDQFKRASLSIPLNIAEGNGKYNKQDKVKFYKITRGSANECGAILDAAKIIGLSDEHNWQRGKEILFRIVCCRK